MKTVQHLVREIIEKIISEGDSHLTVLEDERRFDVEFMGKKTLPEGNNVYVTFEINSGRVEVVEIVVHILGEEYKINCSDTWLPDVNNPSTLNETDIQLPQSIIDEAMEYRAEWNDEDDSNIRAEIDIDRNY